MLLVLGDFVRMKLEIEDYIFLFRLPKGSIVCSLGKRDFDCTVFQTSETDFAV